MKPRIHTVTAGYFPNAIEALARHAQYGNDKHNPGEPLHWAFHKSVEHAESAARHLAKAGQIDPETGKSHTVGAAMRILMLLETELIADGAEPGFAVDLSVPEPPTAPVQPSGERWGVFRSDFLTHGFITVLDSALAAYTCHQYSPDCRVAKIECVDGEWREKLS